MTGSFFTGTTAKNVWKTVIGVSSAGMRRGRGKGMGRAQVKDFNKGQIIGVGRKRLILGGLNTPVITANKPSEVQDGGQNVEFQEKLSQVRKEMETFRKFREMPIERGWSGRRAHGRHAGQPDDHNDTSFDGFDSVVLMLRPLESMKGILGRSKSLQALVVTGNKNGLAGFAKASGKDGRAVVRHARNRAAQSLVYVPRWENRTVLHDFFSKYYYTTVFVQRMPEGYGLRAHRCIRAICEMFGITDLYAKVEGTINQINITKAFFLGLMNQKSYQEIADEKKLHLVDLRSDNCYFPQILASPKGQILTDIDVQNKGENLDFTYYINDGKIKEIKREVTPEYKYTPTWDVHLDRVDLNKNREKTRLMLAAKYGDARVLDVFPYFKTTADSFNKGEEL